MVTMERDLLRLKLNQAMDVVVMDIEDMEVMVMEEDMVTMERDLLMLNRAIMVVIDMEDMEVMVVMDMEDIMVKKRSIRIKPKKTLKTTQSISITKIAIVLSSVRIFKILNN